MIYANRISTIIFSSNIFSMIWSSSIKVLLPIFFRFAANVLFSMYEDLCQDIWRIRSQISMLILAKIAEDRGWIQKATPLDWCKNAVYVKPGRGAREKNVWPQIQKWRSVGALRGDPTVTGSAVEYRVHSNLVRQRKKKLMEGTPSIFPPAFRKRRPSPCREWSLCAPGRRGALFSGLRKLAGAVQSCFP